MKTRYFIIALSVAGILFSCNKISQNEIPAPAEQVTITVTLPDDATKAGVGEKTTLSWTWQAGDKLTVVGETTEIFTIKSGFTPKKAEFTGAAVKGEKFSIYYPGQEEAESDWSAQVQNGNNNLNHLKYVAALKDVDNYLNFSFNEDWAAEHGGTISQIGVLKFVLTPPDGTTNISEVSLSTDDDLFYSGNGDTKTNKLTLALQNIALNAGDVLTAWMITSWNEATVPAGTAYKVTMIADEKTYTQKVSKSAASTLKSGAVSVITLSNASLWKDDTPRYASGEGTDASPYIITEPKHMMNIADDLLAGATTFFKLGADIDMTGITWVPIACYDGKNIVFDGDNHTIKNLNASLISVLDGTVKNLVIDAATVSSSAIAGILVNQIPAGVSAGISNVQIKNSSITSTTYVGGLVGQTDGSLTLGNTTVENTNVTGTLVGGVVGFFNHNGSSVSTMDNCSYIGGTITASARYCGGLIGSVSQASHVISNSLVKDATINSTKDRVGGAIGQLHRGGARIETSRVENTNITGSQNVGGCVGVLYGCADRCSVTGGSVTCTTSNLGGFVGYPEGNADALVTITNCYTKTWVNGGSCASIGGFIGICKAAISVHDCYEACTVTGSGTGVGAFIGSVDYSTSAIKADITNVIAWDNVLSVYGRVVNAGTETGITDLYCATSTTMTISQIAQMMNWSTEIWDLSGSEPTLK